MLLAVQYCVNNVNGTMMEFIVMTLNWGCQFELGIFLSNNIKRIKTETKNL